MHQDIHLFAILQTPTPKYFNDHIQIYNVYQYMTAVLVVKRMKIRIRMKRILIMVIMVKFCTSYMLMMHL